MGKHLEIKSERIPDGVRRTYSTPAHVQRIEELLENQSGKLVSVLDFGNNRVTEYMKYVPANSSIALVSYKRVHKGKNHVAPRAEAVSHVKHIESLFRDVYLQLR